MELPQPVGVDDDDDDAGNDGVRHPRPLKLGLPLLLFAAEKLGIPRGYAWQATCAFRSRVKTHGERWFFISMLLWLPCFFFRLSSAKGGNKDVARGYPQVWHERLFFCFQMVLAVIQAAE